MLGVGETLENVHFKKCGNMYCDYSQCRHTPVIIYITISVWIVIFQKIPRNCGLL